MDLTLRLKPSQLIIFGLVVVSFVCSAMIYVEKRNQTIEQEFKQHIVFIADDIWALNQKGTQAYLQSVLNLQNFRNLSVIIPKEEVFVEITAPPLSGIWAVMENMGLIWDEYMEEPILYGGLELGRLQGVKQIRIVLSVLNIFAIHLLLLLLMVVFDTMLQRRKVLEELVSERTRNLQESEARFHDLVNLLPEMVFEVDLGGTITYANREARERLGLAPADQANQIGNNLFSSIHNREGGSAEADFRTLLVADDRGLKEFLAKDKSGHFFPVLICAATIEKNGQYVGARLVGIDITERQKMEEQLRKDQKMKAIGLMAGGVAHDLNNILSGVVSYPELMLLKLPVNSPLRKPLESIQKAGLDASEVVSDLLTVARGIVAEEEITAPNELIQEYLKAPDFLELSSRYPMVRFQTFLEPRLGNITCSAIHLRKCIMNLVTNGVEAMVRSGVLTITTENQCITSEQMQQMQLKHGGQYVKISISDTGSGIAAAEIEQIFEPFYTKKVLGRSGTGLGLAVVWNIMRDHGGAVNVTSSSRGTTFELLFPKASNERTTGEQACPLEELHGNGEQVLVVDDEPRQREVASQLLTSLNYQVKAVPSGEQAVEYIQGHRVDLVVLDMLMEPGCLNGRETYRKMTSIRPGIKALIASGFAEDDDVRATLALGAGGFLAKPYTLEQLGIHVQSILRGKETV